MTTSHKLFGLWDFFGQNAGIVLAEHHLDHVVC